MWCRRDGELGPLLSERPWVGGGGGGGDGGGGDGGEAIGWCGKS